MQKSLSLLYNMNDCGWIGDFRFYTNNQQRFFLYLTRKEKNNTHRSWQRKFDYRRVWLKIIFDNLKTTRLYHIYQWTSNLKLSIILIKIANDNVAVFRESTTSPIYWDSETRMIMVGKFGKLKNSKLQWKSLKYFGKSIYRRF